MARRLLAPRTPWRANFPPIIGHTSYRVMRDHANYRAAKDGIDNDAALDLVYELLSDEKVEQMRLSLGGTLPTVVAVHAEELSGRNKIPMAYGKVLAEALGLKVEPQIVQASVANHGGSLSIYHRLVSPAIFDGPVTLGAEYLIVDDTCAAGGTLANLKGFIEMNGGVVVAMSVVALGKAGASYWIALADSTLGRLKYRHRGLDALWREEFGFGIDTLTEGEAGHLLKAPSVGVIRDRLASARRDLDINGDGSADERESGKRDDDETTACEPATHI